MTIDAQSVRAMKPRFTLRPPPPPEPRAAGLVVAAAAACAEGRGREGDTSAERADGLEEASSVHEAHRKDGVVRRGFRRVNASRRPAHGRPGAL